ncbi:hypothetical protein [Streptomyces fulvorobeus]|uniref:Uncharacterized protein n=1 Tax=Streptomyces fulvorobeus TaxID=284028 RepID=A0A7J0C4J2_9ACTN|nr:hypothetical protein [Streptomyces fulvorobeus]NYE40704.1 hypothetical protein [Streptomyces fulvorobeus]GFM97007.1 hypothetical protein Sfulv_18180 [Streptomyces fulvorobeus]
MKTAIAIVGIAAAVAAGVAGVLALISLRRQGVEAEQASTWSDIENVRKLALSVDARARWVAWMTMLNALLGLLLACAVLLEKSPE